MLTAPRDVRRKQGVFVPPKGSRLVALVGDGYKFKNQCWTETN